VYEAEGNDPQTYLLLYRHAQLVLNYLDKHPEKNLPENKKALKAAKDAVLRDLEKLEVIRPRIAKRHEEYQERRKAQLQALEALEGRTDANTLPRELDGLSLQRSRAKRRSYEKATLDAGENRSLAARLAQREVRRRDVARRSVRQAGVSEEEEHERRVAGMWGDWEKELRRDSNEVDNDLSSQIQEVARMQNGHKATPNFSVSTPPLVHLRGGHQLKEKRPTSVQSTSSYQYPSVPHKSAQERWSSSDMNPAALGTTPALPPKELYRKPSNAATGPPALPPKPPKPSVPSSLFENPRAPPIPGKYTNTASAPPPLPDKYTDTSSTAPSTSELDEFTFKPNAYLENGEPLRTVFLPPNLRHEFLRVASRNTARNLETCGILCGILKSNALFITRLLIPEQTSTSDTCETVNEQEYFEYLDKEELMVLGWIHTHPSQTCFMSSRDLHTHSGYQVMMPEAVAIVCAPSKRPR
jgi:STAM-binding protein